MAFLKEAESGIEDQKDRNDHGLRIIMETKFDHNDGFQHPGDRRPEFTERAAEKVRGRVGHGIRSGLLKPSARFSAGKPAHGGGCGRRGVHLSDTIVSSRRGETL